MTDTALLENTVVRGTVRALDDGFAVIDVDAGVSGRIALTEFGKPPVVSPGDPVEVLVEVIAENKEAVLSKEKADQLRKWDTVVKAHAESALVEGTVVAKITGGFSVDIGLRAVLPAKHADLTLRNAEDLVGQKLQFRILKLEEDEARVVLSRRVLLAEGREAQKKETLAKLKEGAILDGTVRSLTDYGAFIDVGGMDGLVHITEMSWGRVGHPREVLAVGDEVQVMVLKYDAATGRIGLGLKQTKPDPWVEIAKLEAGARVTGKVTSLTDYGAFVSIAPGVEGLIHVSEMSWARVTHPSKVVSVGDEVSAVVLDLDAKSRRLRLGMRQLAANPWTQIAALYPIGSIIRGRVRSVTDFGVFVGVQEGVDGLVHVSELSWTQRVKPGDLYKKGDTVEAMVLDIDVPNERFSLGIRQLKPDPWTELLGTHPVGSVCKGKVTRVVDFGCFVEIEPGIEGLVHVSQLRDERVENPRDVVKAGDEVSVRVIDLEPEARKVSLSMRAAQDEDFDYRETMRALEREGRASFADVLAGKLPRG